MIANYWSSHHEIFRSVERHHTRLVQLNMMWLASIVWLPFPTALISRDVDGGYGTLYVASLLVVSLLTLAIVLHLGRCAELLSAAGVLELDRHRRSSIAPTLALVAALVISLFSQRYGIWSLLLLVAAQVIAGRLRKRRAAPARTARSR